ncbi:hypothetical protein ACHAPT_000489 [Fusarium lateritium]
MRVILPVLLALQAALSVAVAIPEPQSRCPCSRNGRRGVIELKEVPPKRIVAEELIIPESQIDELEGSKIDKVRELHTRADGNQRLGLSSQQLQKISGLDKSTRRRAAMFLGFSKEVTQAFAESDPPFSPRAVYLLEKELEAKAKQPRFQKVLERYDAVPKTPKDNAQPVARRSEGDLFDTSRLPKEDQEEDQEEDREEGQEEDKGQDLEKRQAAGEEPRLTDEQILKIETLDKKSRAKAAGFLKFNPALYKLFVHNGPPYQPWVIRMLEKELNEKAKNEGTRKILERFDAVPKAFFVEKKRERRSVGDELVNSHLEGQKHLEASGGSSANDKTSPQVKPNEQKLRSTEEADAKAAYDKAFAEKMQDTKDEGWCDGLRGQIRKVFSQVDLDKSKNGQEKVHQEDIDCFWERHEKKEKLKPNTEDISVANDGFI